MRFYLSVLGLQRLRLSLLIVGAVLSINALRSANAAVGVLAEDAKLDSAERQRVIDTAIRNLKEHYVDRDAAQKMADVLLAHEKNGDDKATTDGAAFAELLTRQMREVSHDMHLEVVYSQDRLPDHPGTPSPESLANYRRALERENCTFETVKILPHTIGYLRLTQKQLAECELGQLFESVLRYGVECQLNRAWTLVVARLQSFFLGAALRAFEAVSVSCSPYLPQEIFAAIAVEYDVSVVGDAVLDGCVHLHKPCCLTRSA